MPYIKVICSGDDVDDLRAELDFLVHFDKDLDDVMPLKENGCVVGFMYLLRNWDHLSLAKLALKVLSKVSYEDVTIEVSLEHEEKSKKSNSAKKKGRSKSRMC